jgi:hypothetical protein
VTDQTEVEWGYRVIENWENEGEPRSYIYVHEVGSGYANKKFTQRKVEWLNKNFSGRAEVVQRTVTYSDWDVVK